MKRILAWMLVGLMALTAAFAEEDATPGDAPAATDAPVPGEATSGETTSGEATSGEATSGEATSGEATSGEATSGEATSGEATSGEATSGEATPGEATPGEATPDEPEEVFSPGYVRLAGGTRIYSDENLKNTLGVLMDGGVVYASGKSESEDAAALLITLSVNGQVMTGWVRADGLTVMSAEEGQAYASSVDPDGKSDLPLEDVVLAPGGQERPSGGWGGGGHGGGHGGGGGVQPGQATTSSHGRGHLDDTPYWGVPLESDGRETRALTLGGEALNLTVASEAGAFTAAVSDNTLTLTLTGDAAALSIGGDALETLFASGIDAVRIKYSGGSLTVLTSEWLSGSAYDRLRARGVTPNLLTLEIALEANDPILTVRAEGETLPVDGQALMLTEGGSAS